MKTTFRRQVTLIIGLLLSVTIVLGVSFAALFNRYAAQKQEASLQDTANSVSELAGAYQTMARMYNSWEFRTNLTLASRASGNDILLCSSDGTVLICGENIQRCPHVGQSIGQSLAQSLFTQEKKDVGDAVSALYEEDRIAVAVPVTDEAGSAICIVVVSVEKTELSSVTYGTLRIFILTALVVFLIVLLTVPHLTRRETNPIKDMAAAARQLAHGNLNVRVATGHQNEEIEELAIAFNTMAIAMQNAENTRQEFVANISHELKTPMTTISGYLDGILDGTIPEEKHKAYIEMVSAEARRLSRIVRSMLDISRIKEKGIPPQQLTEFNICESAGQALLSFEQRITRRNLNVDINMPEFGLNVSAHSDYITQVFYNLLDNAVKFIDDGGTLSIHITEQGKKALVTVANTGPTIAPEELPMIFERFHKTDKSRSTDRDGVGLGLYIVKTIILAHGEDIYIRSQDGRTEFTFTMPLCK